MAPLTGVKAIREELAHVLLAPADAIAISVHGRTEAAVLVPLYLDGKEIHVVFTKRHEELRRHGGEISFPGGRREEDGATFGRPRSERHRRRWGYHRRRSTS